MPAPTNYHGLPPVDPASKGNFSTGSEQDIYEAAELVRPRKAGLETKVATMARVAVRIFDRLTGKAMGLEEITPAYIGAVDSATYAFSAPYDGEPVNAVAATGILTGTTIAADDTVTIGTLTYTFVAELTEDTGDAVPFEILVGATDSDSLDNLIAAINGDAGEGTLYGTGTTAQTLLSAAAGTGDTIDLAADTAGTAGNGIATTATLTAGGFGAATLTGGTDGTPANLGRTATDGTDVWTALTDDPTVTQAGWVKTFTA